MQGKQSTISGIDPATIAHFYRFDWVDRAPSARSRSSATDGAIVTEATPRTST